MQLTLTSLHKIVNAIAENVAIQTISLKGIMILRTTEEEKRLGETLSPDKFRR